MGFSVEGAHLGLVSNLPGWGQESHCLVHFTKRVGWGCLRLSAGASQTAAPDGDRERQSQHRLVVAKK